MSDVAYMDRLIRGAAGGPATPEADKEAQRRREVEAESIRFAAALRELRDRQAAERPPAPVSDFDAGPRGSAPLPGPSMETWLRDGAATLRQLRMENTGP